MVGKRLRWPVGVLVAAILLEWTWHLLGFWAWGLPDPWPPVYWAQGIVAQVVDEGGRPLKDVVVTANWEIQRPAEGHSLRQIAVMETVTDDAGRFSFPSWGPRLHWPTTGVLDPSSPQLLLFKKGYAPVRLVNDPFHPAYGPSRQSDWNGGAIELAAFHGDLQEYAKLLHLLDSDLEFAFLPGSCDWKDIPRMLVAVSTETQDLRERHVPTHLYNLHSIEDRAREVDTTRCGSMNEMLGRYAP